MPTIDQLSVCSLELSVQQIAKEEHISPPRRYTSMQLRTRIVMALGALYVIALALASSSQAMTMQPLLERALSASAQEPQQPDTNQPNRSASKSETFTGTIVKNGSGFVLKDMTGSVYRLDAPEKAEPFEGKDVKITGKLEAETKLLHIEAINA